MNNTKEQLEMINQQIKEMAGLYRNAVSRSGISENEFWIWYALVVMDGTFSQQDICSVWAFSKQTVNTIISHMVQKGYAHLEMVPGTKNRKLIRLTEDGKKRGEEVVLPVFQAEMRALERLPSEDRALIYSVLGRYTALLREELT